MGHLHPPFNWTSWSLNKYLLSPKRLSLRWKTHWAQPTDIESEARFCLNEKNILQEFIRKHTLLATHRVKRARKRHRGWNPWQTNIGPLGFGDARRGFPPPAAAAQHQKVTAVWKSVAAFPPAPGTFSSTWCITAAAARGDKLSPSVEFLNQKKRSPFRQFGTVLWLQGWIL